MHIHISPKAIFNFLGFFAPNEAHMSLSIAFMRGHLNKKIFFVSSRAKKALEWKTFPLYAARTGSVGNKYPLIDLSTNFQTNPSAIELLREHCEISVWKKNKRLQCVIRKWKVPFEVWKCFESIFSISS